MGILFDFAYWHIDSSLGDNFFFFSAMRMWGLSVTKFESHPGLDLWPMVPQSEDTSSHHYRMRSENEVVEGNKWSFIV